MPNAQSKRQRLAIAAESTYSTDPDATGAAYSWVRLLELGMVEDQKNVLPTGYFTGRNTETPHELGNDGGTLQVKVPLVPLATAANAGVSPPADDYLDLLLNSAFGANVSFAGASVSSSASTTLTTGTSPAGAQDLLAVRDAAISPNGIAGATQWRRTSSSASPYTVQRAWDANPTATGVLQGTKRWGPLSDPGGATLTALHDLDSTLYLLTGGRPTSAKLTMMSGQMAFWDFGLRFDTVTPGASGHASLPALAAWTGTVLKGQQCLVEWGGTLYPVKSVEIDFRLGGSDNESCQGTNGRANIDNLVCDPLITITPLFATGWETDFRAGTQRNLMIRYGSGVLSGGAVYTWGCWFENAQVADEKKTNDGNRVRQQIQIAARDPGIFSGSTAGRYWQLARC